MDQTVYKHVELTGTSANSMEEAIGNAIAKAGRTVRDLRWFEVIEIRGAVTGATVAEWQVTVKVGFAVED